MPCLNFALFSLSLLVCHIFCSELLFKIIKNEDNSNLLSYYSSYLTNEDIINDLFIYAYGSFQEQDDRYLEAVICELSLLDEYSQLYFKNISNHRQASVAVGLHALSLTLAQTKDALTSKDAAVCQERPKPCFIFLPLPQTYFIYLMCLGIE